MADVKWIKIVTDIFDDEKMLLIESLPEADSIIVIWFKLLCLAGKQNNSGVFIMNNKIVYTDKMLSTIFRRKESTVQLALRTFEDFGMIEIVEGAITIPNWEKHQQLDKLEAIKEQTRERVAKHRAKQKELANANEETKLLEEGDNKKDDTCNVTEDVTVTQGNATDKIRLDKIREDKNIIKVPYEEIKNLFHEICLSYSKIRSLSDNRKKTLKARFNENGNEIEVFRELFTNAENSDFLSGRSTKWKADFDWLINQANMIKVLEGKYNNQENKETKAKHDLSHLVNTKLNSDIDYDKLLASGEIM